MAQAKKRPDTEASILKLYRQTGGKIKTVPTVSLKDRANFARFYTPGVGVVASHLAKKKEDARTLSWKKNSVAIVSDGSAVLGLGNIGPYGALPVMEGKALLFSALAGIDAVPLVLDTQDPEEIIRIVRALAPGFGGINLEDIAAPQCFAIEQALTKELNIPVMHDDQHGTAIVVTAALLNAAKVVRKKYTALKVVIIGAGAAGSATADLLLASGIKNIVVVDRQGIVASVREDLGEHKRALAERTNPEQKFGDLSIALLGADVVIGLSGAGRLTEALIETMAERAIVFALANPVPEIMPELALRAGAMVVGTGRSDFPNQINNALVFPGVFRGALDRRVGAITVAMKVRAAKALAGLVTKPTATKIIPDILDKKVVPTIARAIR